MQNKMRRLALPLVVLFAGLAPAPASVEAQGFTTERFKINLSVPAGYCPLDTSHPVDASVIKLWQQTFAVREQLVAAAVECAQLGAWRKPPLLLVDFSQYLVVSGWQYEGLTYDQRTGLPATLCRTVRQQTGQAAGDPKSGLETRLSQVLAALKVGESKLVGVIGEEPAACYAVVVARAQTSTGEPASVVHVRATAVVKGRVLQFYLTAHRGAGKEVAALHRSAEVLKNTIRAHLAANP